MTLKNHQKTESDRSEDEKVIGGGFTAVQDLDLLADPDAHLSPQERAAIVCP
jgi:hypothetical protein